MQISSNEGMPLSNVAQPLVQASLLGEAIDPGPVLVLVADENMNYVAVNAYACEVLGYTREELIAQKAPNLADGGRLTKKDGTTLELEYRVQPTSIAGMLLSVCVAWAAAPTSSPPAARARRSARVNA